nr:DUF2335 domain-containing protein [Paracoccus amoyensis]
MVETERLVEGWSGSVPDPEILVRYESIMPGAVERILDMAEEEQKQRISLQIEILKAETKSLLLTRIVAFGLQVSSILLSVAIYIYSDRPSSLFFSIAILAFPALSALVAYFFFMRKHEGEEE